MSARKQAWTGTVGRGGVGLLEILGGDKRYRWPADSTTQHMPYSTKTKRDRIAIDLYRVK